MNAGDEITIEATELVAGGAALARIDGFPIFVPGVFPGDVARVRLTEVRKGFARGEMVEVVRSSTLRRAEPCPIAEECGGCDWTALRLDAQLLAKERILRESLRRIGKIASELVPPITIHPSPLNYRLRSRLHRQGDAVGFYAMRSHRVVPLSDRCEVVGVETAKQFGTAISKPLPEIRPATDRASDSGAASDSITVWELGGRLITEGPMQIGPFQVSTDAFFQVNRHLLTTMQELVKALASRVAERRTAIDLYAGVGFFTAPLATLFDSVISVEGSPVSHELARKNLPSGVRTVHAPVESYAARMPAADLVFLDPPRSGAQRSVIDAVAKKARSMVCFLACDPVTFSRDASRLIASGWRLSTLDLLDLFPNTHHVETLSSFERAR